VSLPEGRAVPAARLNGPPDSGVIAVPARQSASTDCPPASSGRTGKTDLHQLILQRAWSRNAETLDELDATRLPGENL